MICMVPKSGRILFASLLTDNMYRIERSTKVLNASLICLAPPETIARNMIPFSMKSTLLVSFPTKGVAIRIGWSVVFMLLNIVPWG